jgi:hypothetical protein
LHASAVERSGKALVLTSVGGVGKTTTACKLVTKLGFRHLADDILLTDSDGRCCRSMRKMMVYPYNSRDIPELEDAVKGGDRFSRLLWDLDRLLRLERRRRRVHARELFPGHIAERATVAATVLLRNTSEPGIHFRAISAPDLATRAHEIVVSEFGPFTEWLRLSTALFGEGFRWSPARVAANNVEMLTSAFGGSCLQIGDLGPDVDPTQPLSELVDR